MTERITPAEVRLSADVINGVAYALRRLATHMEADERKIANVQEAWQELGAEIARLKDALHAYNTVTGDGAYHVWIPDEDNHLESLICPVVIPSEWLRNMVAERDELAATNRLFMDCMKRACRMWQDAHPDRPLMWPDDAKNIAWLLAQNDTLAAKVQEYEARMKGRVLVPVKTRTRFGGGYRSDPSCGCRNPTEYLWGVGDTPEEAIANLQAAIDEEEQK